VLGMMSRPDAGMPERTPAAAGMLAVTPVAEAADEPRDGGPEAGAVRRWLARELHDGVVQTLTSMLVDLELLKAEPAGPTVRPRLETLQGRARSALHGLRHLVSEVRGEAREVHDFEDRVATLLSGFEGSTGIRCTLQTSPLWPTSLTAPQAFHLHRIVEEALRNVHYHSGAGQVTVGLETEGRRLVVTVADDGRGIDWLPGAAGPTGIGILGMRERALLLGGRLSVASPPGGGTTVTMVMEPDMPVAWR
jgi:two-component system, NarL family, sensor histidine kinase UhpB